MPSSRAPSRRTGCCSSQRTCSTSCAFTHSPTEMAAWRDCSRSCCCTRPGSRSNRSISFETAIEGTKAGYYDALQASSQKWHEGQHWMPGGVALRGRDAREGVSRVRGSCRRDERQARREAGHDSRRCQPVAPAVSLRRSRARAAGHQSSHDRARASRAQRRRRRAMRRTRAGRHMAETSRGTIALRRQHAPASCAQRQLGSRVPKVSTGYLDFPWPPDLI